MAFQKKQNNGAAAPKAAPANQTAKNLVAATGTVVLTNTTTNPMLLNEGVHKIMIYPKELKSVDKEVFQALQKNDMIKIWLDKGLIRCNYQADAQEAERKDISVTPDDAPAELTNPVEKHEDGRTVSAEVKKKEAAGSITLD